MGTALSALGTAAAENAGILVAPVGFAAFGGGAGFLFSDFLGETIKAAVNLTGRAGVTAEIVTKSVTGVGLLGLGWKFAKIGPLGKIGFFAAGIGSMMSAVVDVVKYLFPIEEWGQKFGETIRGWLRIGEGVVENANRMSRAEYEKIMAKQREQGGGAGQGVVMRL